MKCVLSGYIPKTTIVENRVNVFQIKHQNILEAFLSSLKNYCNLSESYMEGELLFLDDDENVITKKELSIVYVPSGVINYLSLKEIKNLSKEYLENQLIENEDIILSFSKIVKEYEEISEILNESLIEFGLQVDYDVDTPKNLSSIFKVEYSLQKSILNNFISSIKLMSKQYEIVLLIFPETGLTVNSKIELMKFLNDLNKTVIIVSSDIDILNLLLDYNAYHYIVGDFVRFDIKSLMNELRLIYKLDDKIIFSTIINSIDFRNRRSLVNEEVFNSLNENIFIEHI